MQKQEFESKTGWKVDAEQYAQIEQIYLNAGAMDKDEFCKDYTKGNGHEIMVELSGKCEGLRAHIGKLDKTIGAMKKERAEVVETLIAAHRDTGFETLREQAVALAGGRREYIIAKCRMAIPLDDREQAWILEILEDEKQCSKSTI